MSNICFLDVRICCFVGEFGVVGLMCGIWESVIKMFYFTIKQQLTRDWLWNPSAPLNTSAIMSKWRRMWSRLADNGWKTQKLMTKWRSWRHRFSRDSREKEKSPFAKWSEFFARGDAGQQKEREREKKKHTFIRQNKRDSQPNIWQAADPPAETTEGGVNCLIRCWGWERGDGGGLAVCCAVQLGQTMENRPAVLPARPGTNTPLFFSSGNQQLIHTPLTPPPRWLTDHITATQGSESSLKTAGWGK